MFNRKKIVELIGIRDIFVPELLILRKKYSRKPVTAVIWTVPIAMVFPRCDIIWIVRPTTGDNGEEDSELKCFMPYNEVMTQIDKFLVPLEGPVPNLKMLKPELTLEVDAAFKEKGEQAKGKFVGVSSDSFLDIDLEEIRKRSRK